MCNNQSIDYKAELLKYHEISAVQQWLNKNPKPHAWSGDIWSWAYWYMPKE